MKKLFVNMMAVAVVSAMVLCGCGGGAGSAGPSEKAETADGGGDAEGAEGTEGTEASGGTDAAGDADHKESQPSAKEVYEKIGSLVELNAPFELPADFILNTYGLDIETLEDYYISISEAAISAETIALARVPAGGDTAAVEDAYKVLVEEKSMEMENYLPDQYEIVKKATIKTKGDWVYLVISENASDIIGIIEENIS